MKMCPKCETIALGDRAVLCPNCDEAFLDCLTITIDSELRKL